MVRLVLHTTTTGETKMTTSSLTSKCPEWAPNSKDAPEGKAKWSGKGEPPKLGSRVVVTMNGLGPGEVRGFFVQGGYLGIGVKLDSPPHWYKYQNKGNPIARVFGAEVRQ
jgi:hypothetical protein